MPPLLRPAVEPLEARWLPALSVTFNGTSLFLGDGTNQNGTPTVDAGTPTLRITINTDGTVDAGQGVSTNNLANDTPAGNVFVRLGNVASQTIVNTNPAAPLAGSLNFFAGNGATTVTVNNDGRIAGDLSIHTGNGTDLISITDADVGGTLTVFTAFGNDTLVFAGSSSVAGNFYPSGVNNLTIPAGTTTSGLINLNNSNDPQPSIITIAGTVQGGVFLSTSLHASDVILISGAILGDLVINAGNGDNDVTLTGNVGGKTVVTTGFGQDEVTASGNFSDNVAMALGDGNNALNLTGPIAGFQVTIVTGNGMDNVVFASSAGGATLHAFLGAGNDTFTYNPGALLARDQVNGGFGVNIFQANTAITWPGSRINFQGVTNAVTATRQTRRQVRALRLLRARQRLRRLRLLAALNRAGAT